VLVCYINGNGHGIDAEIANIANHCFGECSMRQKKRITIADVALKAGVSKQTVSRVINQKPDVAPHTRKQVKDVIKAMGYTPDPIARSMKGKTQTLGCITPNFTDFNFSSIIQAAQHTAQDYGFSILFASAETDIQFPPVMDEMINRRVDGLLVINPRDDHRYHHLLPIIDQGMPITYIKNAPVFEQVPAICLDDEQGGFIAAKYLLSLGHTSIVIILGPENEASTRDRLTGFQKALRDENLEVDQKLIMNGDWTAESGKAAIDKLLSYGVPFSAIFALNDWMAIGALQALKEAGLRVPQDVSVIGFDGLPITAYIDPPLTTIKQPIEQFGRLAVKTLIEAIQKPDFHPEVIRLSPSLVIRKTCAPI